MPPLYTMEPGEIAPPGVTALSLKDQEDIVAGRVHPGPASFKRNVPVVSRPVLLLLFFLHPAPFCPDAPGDAEGGEGPASRAPQPPPPPPPPAPPHL